MERVTFQDRHVAARVNRDYVAVKLNAGDNLELFREYGGRRIPLIVWAASDGSAIARLTGYRDPADLLAEFPDR